MDFKPRFEKPEIGNKYYIRIVSGGYNPCIAGNPLDKDLDVLANCVGYATARFNEIGGYGECKYLGSRNAEDFITLAKSQGLKISQKPVLGGCMVWAKGEVGNSADGCGHVAIVEQLNPDGSIITSESGYGYKAFYTTVRRAPNWEGSAYRFLGCIVNPAVSDIPSGVIRKGDTGYAVRWMQGKLASAGYLRKTEIDGDFGKITLGAVCGFQLESGLEVDGICGPITKAALAKY